MAKEPAPPKAVNIIRPTHSFTPAGRNSRAASVISQSSYASAPPTARKPPKVPSTSIVGPQDTHKLNIYQPSPPRQHQNSEPRRSNFPSYQQSTTYSPKLQPEIYKPSSSSFSSSYQQQQYVSQRPQIKSLTVPTTTPNATQPIPRRPTSQQQRVLGPIVKPSAESQSSQQQQSRWYPDAHGDSGPGASCSSISDIDDEDDKGHVFENASDQEEEEDPVISEARVNRKVKCWTTRASCVVNFLYALRLAADRRP